MIETKPWSIPNSKPPIVAVAVAKSTDFDVPAKLVKISKSYVLEVFRKDENL